MRLHKSLSESDWSEEGKTFLVRLLLLLDFGAASPLRQLTKMDTIVVFSLRLCLYTTLQLDGHGLNIDPID